MNNAPLAAAGMALAAAVLWGTTGTAQSFAPAHTSAVWVGALRLLVSTAFFAMFVAWTRAGLAVPAGVRRWVVLAGACMAAYNLSFFAGVRAAGVAVGTVLTIGSGPVWAGLLQWLVLRRLPSRAWWLGTVAAVAGAALLLMGAGADAAPDASGVGLCLLGGLSYASYTLIIQRLVSHVPPATVTLWSFGAAAAMALPAAALMAGPLASTPRGWMVIVYLGVVATGVAYLLFSHALRHLSGATGVTLALAEPVAAFALAVVAVGERPGPAGYAGLALVLAGLMLVVWTEARAA